MSHEKDCISPTSPANSARTTSTCLGIRVHHPQVVHDAVHIQLPGPEDDVLSGLLYLGEDTQQKTEEYLLLHCTYIAMTNSSYECFEGLCMKR